MTTTDQDDPMREVLDELARIVLAEEPLEAILDRITVLTKRLLPGAAEVSVTLIEKGRAVTAAATGDLAVALDERQYQAGHGPCLDAARTGTERHIRNMATEIRWPDYGATAAEAGALSSLSIPLPVQETPIGSLNIYATRLDAFGGEDADLARAFAGYAAIALHNAQVLRASRAMIEQLQQAMGTRAVIEQAKGVLMGQRRIDGDAAFNILRQLSQHSNRKLHDVAQAVVDMAGPDNPR